MRYIASMSLAACLIGLTALATASAGPLPKKVGKCGTSNIAHIGTRIGGPGSRPNAQDGTSVDFANGGHQVSYDLVKAIAKSRVGDKVRICLVSIPKHCPPGDDRGRFYRTTNLRTGKSWTLPDAQHMCGGA